MDKHGFAVEYNGVWAAIKDSVTGEVTCYDLSGFLGSKPLSAEGVFFESPNNDSICNIALQKATDFYHHFVWNKYETP